MPAFSGGGGKLLKGGKAQPQKLPSFGRDDPVCFLYSNPMVPNSGDVTLVCT